MLDQELAITAGIRTLVPTLNIPIVDALRPRSASVFGSVFSCNFPAQIVYSGNHYQSFGQPVLAGLTPRKLYYTRRVGVFCKRSAALAFWAWQRWTLAATPQPHPISTSQAQPNNMIFRKGMIRKGIERREVDWV